MSGRQPLESELDAVSEEPSKHHRSTQGGDDVAPALVMSTSAYKTRHIQSQAAR